MPQVQIISNPQGAFGLQAQVGYEVQEYQSCGAFTTDAATTGANVSTIHSTAAGFTPDDVGGIVVFTTVPSTSAPYISTITAANSTAVTIRDVVSSSGAMTNVTLLRQLTQGMPVITFSTALICSSSLAGGASTAFPRGVTAQVAPTTLIGSQSGVQIAGVVLSREAPGSYQVGSVPASTVVQLLQPVGGTVRVLRFGSMTAAASSVGPTLGAVPGLHVTSSVPLSGQTATLAMSPATVGAAAVSTAVGSTGLSPGFILGVLNSSIAANTTWFTQMASAHIDLR